MENRYTSHFPAGWRVEAAAGVTTFFTMAYIVVVNPLILSAEGTGLPFAASMTATVLVCFLGTLGMGLYAGLPFAIAPGMGVNAFFAYSVILGAGVPWKVALGMVFWIGLLALVISATRLREVIAKAIPRNLRSAVAVGIGMFLTFIGLKNAGIIVSDPVTFVKLGTLGVEAWLALAAGGIMAALLERKNPFALLAGMGAATAAGWALGYVKAPESLLSRPDFSLAFQFDALGALKLALLPTMIALLFTDMFDSLSTFMGVSQATGLLDRNGDPKNLRGGLIVDSLGTLFAGVLGTSSGTAYIESAAGIEAGGRTGLTSVVTALCFLPCLFFAPIAGMVPAFATAPVLILVGALMFRSVTELEGRKLEDLVPAFLTVTLIPLTFSITQGILWGFLSHAGLYAMAGRRREVQPMQWALAGCSGALILLEHSRWN